MKNVNAMLKLEKKVSVLLVLVLGYLAGHFIGLLF